MDSEIVVVTVAAVLLGLGLMVFTVLRVSAAFKEAEADRSRREGSEALQLDSKLRELAAAQGEILGRFSQAIESQSRGHVDLQRTVSERLEALDKRLGDNLKDTAAKTAEALGGLQTRLSVIDDAQRNLTDLSGNILGLQQILANKQARGAWGQGQMESIIRDALPPGLYEFQARLSNNSRPDCLIRLPAAGSAIVIDSKFPLESFALLKAAAGETEKRAAEARVRADVGKHVKDIADKYLIPGETQTPAMMFVPSESLYAELHDSFPDMIQKAHRSQVIVVSPNILLLAINTMQTVMKDARMREQANLIQREVGVLMKDVGRLADRVEGLRRHFAQAEGDVRDIAVSAEKIMVRGSRIEKVEFTPVPALQAPAEAAE